MLEGPDIQVQYEAIKSYVRLLKVITKNSFDEQWTEIFNFSWNKIQIAQPYIEKIGFGEDTFDISGQLTPPKSGKVRTLAGDVDDNQLINAINDSGELA